MREALSLPLQGCRGRGEFCIGMHFPTAGFLKAVGTILYSATLSLIGSVAQSRKYSTKTPHMAFGTHVDLSLNSYRATYFLFDLGQIT